MTFERDQKRRNDMRLVVGVESGGGARPLRTDADGRLEIVNYRTVHAARAYHSAAQSIATAAWTALALDSEYIDSDGMHDLVTNNSRLTVINAGTYMLGGSVSFAASAVGIRGVGVRLNGGAVYPVQSVIPNIGAVTHTLACCGIYALAVGDYLELMAYQSSGGGLNVNYSAGLSPILWAAML